MATLGHDTFAVAGHDRGGRVAYRMALDIPGSFPTGGTRHRADRRDLGAGRRLFALGYWHWPFLAQPAPLPERLILGDPEAFWIAASRMGIRGDDERYPAEVVDAYRAQLANPELVSAMCEDYRAGATIDRALDDADRGQRTIACPVLVLWGADGGLPRFYEDPLELWRTLAPGVSGHAVERAGHFIPEDQPAALAAELADFFA